MFKKRKNEITLEELKKELLLAKEEIIKACSKSNREVELENIIINIKASKISAYEKRIEILSKENECQKEHIRQVTDENIKLKGELEDIKTRYKKTYGEKGGLISTNTKLKKELEELNKKLNDSKSDKLIVKKIRGTKPTQQITRLHNKPTGFKIAEMLKEINNAKEEFIEIKEAINEK